MNRRVFLKNLGLCTSLPFLPSLFHQNKLFANSHANKNICFLYIPNGVVLEHWIAKENNQKIGVLPKSLQKLSPHIPQLHLLKGLTHQKAFANGDGAGDHARANATFLTGKQAKKTAGPDIQLGISIDQVIANHSGQKNLLPSLELGCDARRSSGICDNGYSCAYQYNLSWKSEKIPMPPEANPQLAYERLFLDPFGTAKKDTFDEKQMLMEEVHRETKSLNKHLNQQDREKLAEYKESLFSVEKRIQKLNAMQNHLPKETKVFDLPENFEGQIRLMFDIIRIAFQTKATQVVSFLLSHEGSNRVFPQIGVNEGHHQISHHKKNAKNLEQLQRIDEFYIEQLAYFLQQLKSQTHENGTLLDDTIVLFGSGISDGDSHSHRNLPIILAGGKNWGAKQNFISKYPQNTPLCNLYLSLLQHLDLSETSFGDSKGALSGIFKA